MIQRRKPLLPGKAIRRTGWAKPQPSPLEAGRRQTGGLSGKPRRPLPVESARHKADRPTRTKVRTEVLARDGGCRARAFGVDGRCGGPLDVHEIISRARWAAGYLEPSNCVTLCRIHHDRITVNPAFAEQVGLSARRPPATAVDSTS